MKIDIDAIAELARLDIDESEREKLERDMAKIIAMVDNLPELSETPYACGNETMLLRRDEVRECAVTREELLSNAPFTENGCFAVPKTV